VSQPNKPKPRVPLIRRRGDHPDPAERAAEAELFATLFPGNPAPEIDESHLALAALAQNPKLALMASRMSGFLLLEAAWGQRAMVRELALQVLNRRMGCSYGAETRIDAARAAGLSEAQIAALDDWRASGLFDPEQQLVIEYTEAALAGPIPDALFARMVEQYGEQQAVECTAVIGFWTFWAMITNAALPDA
jgi:alkylhydroperoxidase family enzyme